MPKTPNAHRSIIKNFGLSVLSLVTSSNKKVMIYCFKALLLLHVMKE